MSKHRLIRASLASGLAIAAVGTPGIAEGHFLMNPENPSPATASALRGVYTASATDSVRAADVSSPSFQWGDAGIGAAGVIVLLGAGSGTVGLMRRRRSHRLIAG